MVAGIKMAPVLPSELLENTIYRLVLNGHINRQENKWGDRTNRKAGKFPVEIMTQVNLHFFTRTV